MQGREMQDYRSASGERRLWFSVDEIENIMENELRRVGLLPTASEPVVNLEELLEIGLHVKLDLHAPLEPGLLGVTEFVRGGRPQVSINSGLTLEAEKKRALPGTLGRWRATLAHEGSHVVLHRRLFEAPAEQGVLFDVEEVGAPRLMRCRARDVSFGHRHSDWREVQANLGMASLLMPANVFKAVVRAVAGADQCNGTTSLVPCLESVEFREFLIEMSRRFVVSQQAAQIRLQALGLVSAETGQMLGEVPDQAGTHTAGIQQTDAPGNSPPHWQQSWGYPP